MSTITDRDSAIALPRVLAVLLVIVVLALAVPYAAVRTLHERRLRAADETLRELAASLDAALADRAGEIPPATDVLAGPGERHAVADERWKSATSFPLARIVDVDVKADPWGNAYVVNLGAMRSGGTVWLLTAGPDGIIQTPFSASAPAGDDRALALRRIRSSAAGR
jgi:type II secretory pathway pseudopilin PulG